MNSFQNLRLSLLQNAPLHKTLITILHHIFSLNSQSNAPVIQTTWTMNVDRVLCDGTIRQREIEQSPHEVTAVLFWIKDL